MNNEEKLTCGITGTILSAVGSALAIEHIQAIISIIITVLGFIISVLIPTILKIYNKIKTAKEDGVITKEEVEDIAKTIKDSVNDIKGGNKDD